MAPKETADALIEGLSGAMDALVLADPADPATDIGPVIDDEAQAALAAHLKRLKKDAKVLHQMKAPANGHYFGPVLAEIPDASFLQREVFGPILHVVRWRAETLDRLLDEIAGNGTGLTLGVHSRIDATMERIVERLPNGNVYVNRNMIGAVVGTQPFGGTALSGTGPKAGGPNYLKRFVTEQVVTINTAAAGGNATLLAEGE